LVLLGGHVEAVSGASNDVLPNKAAGNFRVLGISGEQPDKSMPDAPTEKSQGYDVRLVLDRLRRAARHPQERSRCLDQGDEEDGRKSRAPEEARRDRPATCYADPTLTPKSGSTLRRG
jgi:hypothetical protein